MKCFYHSSDLDGHCSGAIVKYMHPECQLIGINYGDKFPWETIKEDEIVFMVDFCLQPFKEMIKLFSKCNHLFWIDHHKSAIEEYEKVQLNDGLYIAGARCHDNSEAGCMLTFQYLFNEKIPRAIKLLSDYDVWNHKDPDVLPFQFGMRQYDTNPENTEFWREVWEIDDVVDTYIYQGSIILKYQKTENEKYIKYCSFETTLDGLKCIAINKMLTNSQIFDSIWDPEKYDAMLTFGFRKGKWTVSLYSDKENIDVSKIAKARGGGGHKGAAGFQCIDLKGIVL